MAGERFAKGDTDNRVATLVAVELNNVFPIFLVSFILIFVPRLVGGEVNRFGIGRPGERPHFFFTERDWKRFPTVGGNQEYLRDFLSLLVFLLLAGSDLPFGEECNPLAVRRKFG